VGHIDDRARRRWERRSKTAGVPPERSLRAFGSDANPNTDAATVHNPALCEWIKKSQPLCRIGDSGTGKSHWLIALGTEAAMKGYRVRYKLSTKLVNELVEAADESSATRRSPATDAAIFSASTNLATCRSPRAR
jgi:DNA replication protein DnaC